MKSTVHISRQALQANFRTVQAVVGSDTEVLAVIKANAYGHGMELCAPPLAEAGATWFGVSDVAEGVAVRDALGAGPRIVVMCGMEPSDAPAILANALTPVVWTPAHIAALQEAAEAANTRCRVHIEIDTGMARQGCAVGEELTATLQQLRTSSRVQCEGMMSHLCCAELADSDITKKQERCFADAFQYFFEAEVFPAYIHLANSSAVDEGSVMSVVDQRAQQWHATTLVRPGLALYGHVLPIVGMERVTGKVATRLIPALSWTTRIIALRKIPAGATVGYGATYTAESAMRLALLPVGYADGFRRGASSGIGNGWVMIAGRRSPVVGRVSMNLTVVDTTEIEEVDVGNEAVLIGEGVTAEDHAQWNGTIAYDILCGIRGNRVLEP